uniref:Uncharacterized protein n=1 Tax=Vespula pensylvanica TaxID=30213 RepID=A0A834UBD9_VESPE|nr:hypothetical protein H0235_007271 [Vespula pensylvanica]
MTLQTAAVGPGGVEILVVIVLLKLLKQNDTSELARCHYHAQHGNASSWHETRLQDAISDGIVYIMTVNGCQVGCTPSVETSGNLQATSS